jgi:hypothetical protein
MQQLRTFPFIYNIFIFILLCFVFEVLELCKKQRYRLIIILISSIRIHKYVCSVINFIVALTNIYFGFSIRHQVVCK